MSKKTYTFVIANPAESDTFEKNFNAEWRIPAQIQITDPRKGKHGKTYIRYIPYEQDVFVDNQTVEFNLVKHRVGEGVMLEKPTFTGGFIRVGEDEQMLLKYLRNHPFNVKNAERNGWRGKKFFEVNKEEIAKERLTHLQDEFSLMKEIFEMDLESLKEAALLTGVITHKDMYDKKVDEMRHDLLIKAKRDPEDFYAAITDDLAEYKKIVYDALSNGVFRLDGRNVIEHSNGNRFVGVTTGDDVIEAAAEKLADDANKDILQMVKRRIRQAKGEKVTATNEEELQEKVSEIKKEKRRDDIGDIGNEVDNMTIETLFLAAKEAGVIESKTPYFYLGETKLNLDESKKKWKESALEFLEEDQETLEQLRTAYFIYKKNN